MSDKSSSTINLVILGLFGAYVALPYLPQGDEVRRNTYRSREECVTDYSEAQCESWSSGGGSGSWGYRGPEYYPDQRNHPNDPGPGRYQRDNGRTNPAVIHTESSFRGGFGNLARRMGAGG